MVSQVVLQMEMVRGIQRHRNFTTTDVKYTGLAHSRSHKPRSKRESSLGSEGQGETETSEERSEETGDIMCEFASGFLRPTESLEVKIADLNGHGETQNILDLPDTDTPDGWREWHYTPDNKVEVRVLPQDTLTARQCQSGIKARWPNFIDFLNWAMNQASYVKGSLYLRGCDLKGIKLPTTVGGSLYLSGCDLNGIKLPKGMDIIT